MNPAPIDEVVDLTWPPPGSSVGHERAVLLSATGQIPLALDRRLWGSVTSSLTARSGTGRPRFGRRLRGGHSGRASSGPSTAPPAVLPAFVPLSARG